MQQPPKPVPPPTQPDVALVVIARNEARCIERCLRSARDAVSRMVVLDTGSTDDTPAIAEACGAQVHHAVWNDDFSAARNAALEIAQADWNLVLDADEWIESGAAELRALTLSEPFLGVILVRSDTDLLGRQEQARVWLPRLLPRGVRYQGRIHEQPVSPLPLPTRRLPLVAGHDGYLSAQYARKADRNRELLLQEIQRRPDDPYVSYQLGKEYECVGEFRTAAQRYVQALELSPPGMRWRQPAAARLLYCLAQAKEFEQAIVVSGDLMEECGNFVDFLFALGNLFLDLAVEQPEQALQQWLPMAEAAWLRCLEIGEQPHLDGVLGRGSFSAAHNLSLLHDGLQDAEKARHYACLAEAMRQQQNASRPPASE